MDQRSLPLGFAWNRLLACDAADCKAEDDNVNLLVQRLNCGHTFQKVCLGKSSHCNDHGYSMSNRASCPICSVQLPLRVEQLASSFNKGLGGGTDDNDGEEPSADDHDGDDDNDDSENLDDDDSDSKPVADLPKLLLKAKESLQYLPHAASFKYSNRNSKPGTSNSEAHQEVLTLATCVPHVVGSARPKGGWYLPRDMYM